MFLNNPLIQLKFIIQQGLWFRYFLPAVLLVFLTAWQQKTDRRQLDGLLELVDRHIDAYALDSADAVLGQALDQANFLQDSTSIRRIYGDMGYVQHLSGNYLASISSYELGYKYAEALRDSSFMIAFSRSIGLNFQRIGLHAVALDHYFESLEMAKIGFNKERLADLYNSIGVLYQQNNEPDLSMDYLRQSLSLYSEIDDQAGVARTYNNIAINFHQKNELDSCIHYNLMALSQKKMLDNLRDISATINNLGEIFLELSLLDSAYEYLEEAYTIHRKMNEPEVMVISYNNFGDYWMKKDNYPLAETYLDSAAQIIEAIQTKELAIENVALKVQLYEKTNRFDHALRTYKTWDSLKTDLFMEEKIQVQELGNLYLLREKEFEREQAAQQASLFEIKSSQFQITSMLLGILGILLAVFSVITYRNFNTQKQLSDQISDQNTVIKAQQGEIRHRISNNLARIQTVLNAIRRKATDSGTKSDLMQAAKILQTASSLERYIYDVEDEFEVPLADYLEGLLNHHREIFALEKSNTRISLTCPPNVILPVDQILNLAIVLDEWVRNTKKFAFSISENPHITILIREENGTLSVDYRDNGSGMKKDATAGIGTGLIEKFTQDLDARITTENDGGIHHCIRFKIQSKKTKSHL